jgi:FKBP-type peptidyl-prolyl cis-trans isomerase
MINGFRSGSPPWVKAITLSLLMSCMNEPVPVQPKANLSPVDDTIVSMNRQVVKDENQEIEDYISRHNWRMERTPTGLRYHIYLNGKGPRPEKGQTVTIRYSLTLLTGENVYSSSSGGDRKFMLGKAETESGLEEGIRMMRKGDRARFILPSHLAHGLLGDLNKIPPRAALVYEVELLNIYGP